MHLEPPTHLFIGGSSGNLKEILTVVKQKNPNVKIVISAISLETVRDVMDAEKEGLLTDMEVTQICASRSRVLGQYHMMTGMNPVYIISAGGKEDGFGNFDHGDLQRKRENSGGVRTYGRHIRLKIKKYHPVNADLTISIRCFIKKCLA